MTIDLDRYYTPEDVALRAMQACELSSVPTNCVDSTCGSGRLLEAASEVFNGIQCVGLDRDRQAITALRRKRPEWILSVGNLLCDRSYETSKISSFQNTEFLVLNPPFSQKDKKYAEINFGGQRLRGSIAMKYLLRSLDLFKPTQGALAILPESLLYSDIDAEARQLLGRQHRVVERGDLSTSTFRGARVRASVVQLMPGCTTTMRLQETNDACRFSVQIVRGGQQMHAAVESRSGTPLIHTTDLHAVVHESRALSAYRLANEANLVSGWMVLLPRVGCPNYSLVRPLYFETPIQLSDCVIALQCDARSNARELVKLIKADWARFVDMYRGTGARYVTLSRVRNWLQNNSVSYF